MRRTILATALWMLAGMASAQDPEVYLFKDINPTADSHSDPRDIVVLNGIAIFPANDAASGREIWRSDGSAAGTYRIKDIVPGPAGSSPAYLTIYKGSVFFCTDAGELWKTDGTDLETSLVQTGIFVQPPQWRFPPPLNVSGDYLYIGAWDGLWRTDGTPEETKRLHEFHPGPDLLTDVAGTLFFRGPQGHTGALWKSDGTVETTVLVSEVNLGSPRIPPEVFPPEFEAVGDTLYFTSGVLNQELWKSNGTAGTTVPIDDIRWGWITGLTAFGAELFFVGNDGAGATSLWKSNGLAGGTVPVAPASGVFPITSHQAQIFFCLTFLDGFELWRTDGSTTARVKAFTTGFIPEFLTSIGTSLYFSLATEGTGNELWRTEGTEATTGLVMDINPGPAHGLGDPYRPVASADLNGSLFFDADDGIYGREPWISEGTEATTRPVTDINLEHGSHSDPRGFAPVGGDLYFVAVGVGTGNELWKTDGTPEGTSIVGDIAPDAADAFARSRDHYPLIDASGVLFMYATDQGANPGLWKADTAGGAPVLVKAFPKGMFEPYAPGPTALTLGVAVGGTVYFGAYDDPAVGFELWQSDGVTTGLVQDIYPGSGHSLASPILAFQDNLILIATHPDYGGELWITDGIDQNTNLVKDIRPGPAHSRARNLLVYGDMFLFDAWGELWRSNGTGGETALVASVSFAEGFVTSAGYVLFAGNDGTGGSELWRTDGTPGNTFLVKDINLGEGVGSFPAEFTQLGGLVIFSATSEDEGRELWRMDTTTGEATLLRDIDTGTASSSPEFLVPWIGGTLVFKAGSELWLTDGTPGETRFAATLPPSVLGPLVRVPGQELILFNADDGVVGRELWAFGVRTAEAKVTALVEQVTDLGLDGGTAASLDRTLQNTLRKLTDDNPRNDTASAGQLQAFIHQVKSKRGRSLTDEEADALQAAAQAVLDGLR